MTGPNPTANLFITDIFKSIQGEGPKLGTPSLFLRLGICNLQCTWCDTPYTWKKGLTDYVARPDEWILKTLRTLKKGTGIKNIVITGGEPLLQQKQLARLLPNEFFKEMEIEFETNGSMRLLPEMQTLINSRISFNISPKLADSGNKPYKVQCYPHAILKFVYVNKKSEKLIDQFLRQNKNFSDVKLFSMPEGTTVAAMTKKYQNTVAYCIKRGFNFTPRLHIYLFGNTRAT